MNEDAVLLVVAIEKDADGFPTETEKEIPVYVREKSATRSEFYAALREGIAVKTVFEIRIEDFEQSAHMVGEKKEYATRIRHDGSVYNIIRTYRTGKAVMELTCS